VRAEPDGSSHKRDVPSVLSPIQQTEKTLNIAKGNKKIVDTEIFGLVKKSKHSGTATIFRTFAG
jgi:hypothetical protein